MTPLERAVLERVILDVHRQPLDRRIERRALRHGPREQDAVVLEAEVVVQVAGEVLLDAEEQRCFFRFAPAPCHAAQVRRRSCAWPGIL